MLAAGACAVALAGGFLYLAALELRLSARYSDLILLAAHIERGQSVSPAVVTKVAADADTVAELAICRRDVLLSGTTVVLRRLDDVVPRTDDEARRLPLMLAEKYLRHALSCAPTDGNLWLRYAFLDALTAKDPARTAKIMGMAARFAPADEVDLIARLYFWNHFNAATLAAAADVVRQDLRLVFHQALPSKITPQLPSVSRALKPFVIEATRDLPEDRRKALARSGVELDKLLK